MDGWDTILAFNPVDRFTLMPGDDVDGLIRFCKTHSGKLISGYLSFELGYQLLDIDTSEQGTATETAIEAASVPLAQFSAYNDFVRFEKDEATCFFQNADFPVVISEAGSSSERADDNAHPELSFTAGLSEQEYQRNFNRVIDYIRKGDIYQINYTHLMRAESDLSGRELFRQLTRTNPVDHAAYLEADNLNIISLSPERFVHITGDTIVTMPIKGTRPRGETDAEDRRMMLELLDSRKEQAELFMITDLLRNDVGKVSQIGSVKVTQPKQLQRLAKVFHTYSRIEGQRRHDISNIEVLISMFPGGSITGCPKRRAVEIIREIEEEPRGIYTGSIGYILPEGDLAFNIAIRTVLQQGKNLTLGVGGGITIESNAEDEYLETFAKARSFATQGKK